MNAFAISSCFALVAVPAAALAQAAAAPAALTLEQKERFLLNGAVSNVRTLGTGITNSLRATLTDGALKHDAHIQSIDQTESNYTTNRGTELIFRDSYRYNIAAYELGKMLGIADMIPPSVQRKVSGRTSAVTWWVDDVLMDEAQRMAKKVNPPDIEAWNRQVEVVRVFDQLICNTDRNLRNMLIDRNWKVWMIDHTRSFRRDTQIRTKVNLTRCDRGLLEKMRAMNKADLKAGIGKWVIGPEIDGLLRRRDQIVKIFDTAAAKDPSVLYDRPR